MRYKYNDTSKNFGEYFPKVLKFSINNVCIDDRICGFQTLNVYGRELIARDIATKNYSTSSAGGKSRYGKNRYSTSIQNSFIASNLGQRQLTVQYRLKSKCHRDMIKNFEELQNYVNEEQAKLSFTDDERYYYIGTFSGFDEVKSENLDIVGKLTFECIDPYKYSFQQGIMEFSNRGTFKSESPYPIQLEEIRIKPSNNLEFVEISNYNNSNKIKILNKFTDEIIINMLEHTIIDGSNRDRMKDLDIFSDLEDFSVFNEDELALVGASSCVVKYRERGL